MCCTSLLPLPSLLRGVLLQLQLLSWLYEEATELALLEELLLLLWGCILLASLRMVAFMWLQQSFTRVPVVLPIGLLLLVVLPLWELPTNQLALARHDDMPSLQL